jgi:hypothetical protein
MGFRNSEEITRFQSTQPARSVMTDHSMPALPEPFHPDASHIDPSFRDGFNHCHKQFSAYAAPLLERIKELEAERDKLLEADMFWDHDDGERFGNDIDEIIQEFGPGEIVKIDQGKRLPMITVRVLPAADDNSYFEYEIIDAAISTKDKPA